MVGREKVILEIACFGKIGSGREMRIPFLIVRYLAIA